MKRRQLTELLGDVVYTYGVEQAQRDGIIPDFDWTVHPTPLDPYEQDEWDETTDRISRQFKRLKHADTTTNLLQDLPVPFAKFEDLGDFIRAHEAAGRTLSEDAIPDEWQNLATTIHSRSWILNRYFSSWNIQAPQEMRTNPANRYWIVGLSWYDRRRKNSPENRSRPEYLRAVICR
jgi:hypothetical protein